MNFIVLGISHKTAPVEIREEYSIKEEDLPAALNALKNIEGVLECAIFSTCNRIEIYALTLADDIEDIKDFLLKRSNLSNPMDEQHQSWIYTFEKEKALEHLCRVSSGLDSMVLGEPQIFGQMKDAYNRAIDLGTADPFSEVSSRRSLAW